MSREESPENIKNHYAPDFASMNRFLSKKDPERWNDKDEFFTNPIMKQHSESETGQLDNLSVQELALMEKMGLDLNDQQREQLVDETTKKEKVGKKGKSKKKTNKSLKKKKGVKRSKRKKN